MDKFHKRTIKKVNKLYRCIYNKTMKSIMLKDSKHTGFAYIKLQDNIKKAYEEFVGSIQDLNK